MSTLIKTTERYRNSDPQFDLESEVVACFERLDIEVPGDLTGLEMNTLNIDTIYQNAMNHRPEVKSAQYPTVTVGLKNLKHVY